MTDSPKKTGSQNTNSIRGGIIKEAGVRPKPATPKPEGVTPPPENIPPKDEK